MILPFQIRRPFRRRRSRQQTIGAPGLSIVGVLTTGAEVVVTFSAAITWDGSTVPGEFKAFTVDEDFQSPINVLEAGANFVRLEFNADVASGAAWMLEGAMDGITPDIAWPQVGVVS